MHSVKYEAKKSDWAFGAITPKSRRLATHPRRAYDYNFLFCTFQVSLLQLAMKTDLLAVKADLKSDIARLEANMAAMESRLVKGEALAGCKAGLGRGGRDCIGYSGVRVKIL